MLVEWKPEFSLDIPKFDSQHIRIFFLINGLHEAMERRHGADALKKTLDELINYTKTHFQDEEKAMAESRFPGLEAHKAEHRKLEKDVEKFYADLASGKAVFSGEVLRFLISWLMDHIAKSDKKYATHFKSRGRGSFVDSALFQKRV
jgi:hemerythrin-like metal-binding protein